MPSYAGHEIKDLKPYGTTGDIHYNVQTRKYMRTAWFLNNKGVKSEPFCSDISRNKTHDQNKQFEVLLKSP